MSIRMHFAGALLLLTTCAVSDLQAQVCAAAERVIQVRIIPVDYIGDYPNIRVEISDTSRATAERDGSTNAWQLVLAAPTCVRDLQLTPVVAGHTLTSVDSVYARGGLGMYEITLEPTWTLAVQAKGEEGPVDVFVQRADPSAEPDSTRGVTPYDGEFRESDDLRLKVYTHKTFYYNVLPAKLDQNVTHDKRTIMDGICNSFLKPEKRYCACQKRWKFLTCMAQKRDIPTESITYTRARKP